MDTQLYLEKKEVCRKALVPFLEMLEDQRSSMSVDLWVAQVSKTELRVTQIPEQYLGGDLPDAEIMLKIVKEIFYEFKEEQVHLA